MDAQDLLQRHDDLVAIRAPFESLWRSVEKLVMPAINQFGNQTAGGRLNLEQHDSFPMSALDKYTAAIEAGLMPRTTLWHFLQTGDNKIDENHNVKIYLDELNRSLWRMRYSPSSFFASQAHEVRQSLGLFGTGAMLVEPSKAGGARYRAIHLSEIYIDENSDGQIDTVHRKFELTARQAVQMFGKRTPDRILKKYNAGKIGDRFEFLHCVSPRDDFAPGRMDETGMPFAGYYLFPDGKEIVKEDGYNEQPYIVSRDGVSTRERYGRGPAIKLLPDIAMLNEMKRVVINAANMTIDPPTMSADNISEYDLSPGTHNPGTLDDNGRPMVVPFNTGVRTDITRDLMSDVRNQIDDGFLGLWFRVLLENPNMTATQSMLIAQQQGQMTMPMVGRLQSEWLGPMIKRESGILFRQGKHPPMPPELSDYLRQTGRPLEIRYESPMTKAARTEDVVAIMRGFQAMAAFAQIDPSIMQAYDIRETGKVILEASGAPPSVIKSDEALAAENEQKAAQAEMGALLQAAPIAAETAKTLAEAQQISGNNPRLQ